jgi:hypothetical protein
MPSIPASTLVNVIPSVLSAGGTGLTLNGLVLTTSTRVPIGTYQSFPSAAAVAAFFGANSTEASIASIYFNGFNGCTQYPTSILFAQYAQAAVYPYLRGGNASGLTLAQLQALNGTLSVTVNGVVRTSGAINLATATSFSNAASLITTGFNTFDAVTSAATTIAAGTATSVTGSITGNILTVTAVSSGALVVGGVLTGTGITTGTTILNQLTGTAGGIGTYTVSLVQTVTSTAVTQSYGLMTVAAMASGTLAVGQVVSGGTTAPGTTITALGTGTGGAGTYITSGGAQTVSATTISAGPLVCTYDSISGAFILTGGTPGAVGTITVATGTISTQLFLTTATGAVTSQGAAASVPAAFMASIVAQTTNWAGFMTAFNPDAFGNAVKLAFAAWTNSTNNRYLYAAWDTDITPTISAPATSSLGYLLQQNTYSGTMPIYDPQATNLAAFVLGYVASVNFNARNGRATIAYKGQSGLTITVNSATVAANLIANGYNFYGQYSTANQLFNLFQPGSVSGLFQWADSYINEIWLNNALQLALLNFLANINSVPYNQPGYAALDAVIAGVATQGLYNGVISAGVVLSAAQIVEVNTAAGLPIDGVLSARGYYAQVLPATPQVRAARTSPPMTLWYMDGGSVQQITLASIEAQ